MSMRRPLLFMNESLISVARSLKFCASTDPFLWFVSLTQWGEGAGGGWFRLQRGVNALAVERFACTWATPAAADVQRALQQHAESIAE
jgi:hypothetical protein